MEPHVSAEALAKVEAPAPQLPGRRAVAVVYSTFPSDPRPRRAAEALASEGAIVEVICLKETDEEPLRECFNGIEITRLPLKRRRNSKLTYVLQYGSFILIAGSILAGRSLKRRYDLVHVHNMPDVLVFCSFVPKMLGSKVILDLHDPMPELMMTIFGLRKDSLAVRILQILEKWSLGFADAVLTANEAFRKIFLSRSCPSRKMTVIMNSPDEEIFQYHSPSGERFATGDSSKPFVIMYHGSLVERHGLDLAVMALEKIRNRIPQAELRVYGRRTPFLEEVLGSARNLGLSDAVRYMGQKNLDEIAKAIRQSDVGVIPNRRSIFTELNMPTRIFEYLSQGRPVIAPSTSGILDYFGPHELLFFELGDAADLAAKLDYVFHHPDEMVRLVERGQAVYRSHQWYSERRRFVRLVSGLLSDDQHSEVNGERLKTGETKPQLSSNLP